MFKRLTPVLVVDAIEPVLELWVDRLGFDKQVEVPHKDRIGFVILARDGVEVMYQTRGSIGDDIAALADTPAGGGLLFVEVENIDAVARVLHEAEIIQPRRQTFYGATEITVRDAGGNAVTFAEFEGEN